MTSEIDLRKEEIIDEIYCLDLVIERIKEELYENNSESNKERLEKLRTHRKNLINERDELW